MNDLATSEVMISGPKYWLTYRVCEPRSIPRSASTPCTLCCLCKMRQGSVVVAAVLALLRSGYPAVKYSLDPLTLHIRASHDPMCNISSKNRTLKETDEAHLERNKEGELIANVGSSGPYRWIQISRRLVGTEFQGE